MRARILLATLLIAGLAPTAVASDKIRVVAEGGIGDEWALAPGERLAAPGYPAQYAADADDVCVAVGYLVHPDGHTSDFALLKSWSSGEESRSRTDYWRAFAASASQAVGQWRFVPRPEVKAPRPVYTVATFAFGASNPAVIRTHCDIPNLQVRLMELRGNSRASRMMQRGIYSELDIDPAFEARARRMAQMQREAVMEAVGPLEQANPYPSRVDQASDSPN